MVEVDSLEPDSSLAELRVAGEYLPAAVSLPAAYNLYNAAAAVAAATALGIEAKAAVRSLAHIESGFGRMERFELDGTQVTMVLVKNLSLIHILRRPSRMPERVCVTSP